MATHLEITPCTRQAVHAVARKQSSILTAFSRYQMSRSSSPHRSAPRSNFVTVGCEMPNSRFALARNARLARLLEKYLSLALLLVFLRSINVHGTRSRSSSIRDAHHACPPRILESDLKVRRARARHLGEIFWNPLAACQRDSGRGSQEPRRRRRLVKGRSSQTGALGRRRSELSNERRGGRRNGRRRRRS